MENQGQTSTSNMFKTPEVSQARQTARQSSETAARSAQSAATLPDMLRDSLTKKFEGNPLYGQREEALGNYFQTSTQAPIDYTHTSAGGNANVVYDPMQQANLIQGARGNALAPITSINALLGAQSGGLDNIINSASRAAQAQVAGLQSQAELDRQSYTDLIDLISRRADEDYRQQQLELQRQRLAQSGSGSNSFANLLNNPDIRQMLGLDGGQGTTTGGDDFWEEVPDDGSLRLNQTPQNLGPGLTPVGAGELQLPAGLTAGTQDQGGIDLGSIANYMFNPVRNVLGFGR